MTANNRRTKTAMNELFEQLKEMMKAALKQDELFDLGAKCMKKTVDALVANGFSREEAVLIVANQGSGLGVNKT